MTGPATPARGVLRALRGAVLAGSCLAVSMTAHVVAGGPVGWGWFDLTVGLLLCTVCVAGADRRYGFWSLFCVVGASQVALHFLAGGHQGMADTAGTSAGMAVSHLVAALLISAVLALGERALWVLVAVLGTPLGRVPTLDVPRLQWVRRPAPQGVLLPAAALQVLVDVVDRRGPPALAGS